MTNGSEMLRALFDKTKVPHNRHFTRRQVLGGLFELAVGAGVTACSGRGVPAVSPSPEPSPDSTGSPQPSLLQPPVETPAPAKAEPSPPQTATVTKPPEATATPEKVYPLGCYDTEINTQAVTEYLAAHPEFTTIDDAMKAHMDTHGKANVWVGGAVSQGSDAQQQSLLYSPLVLKYSVVKYPSDSDTINVGCVTLAYPRYEKNDKFSVGTVTILTDVEKNGKWTGSPFIFGLKDTPGATVFASRSEFKEWLFDENRTTQSEFKLQISEQKNITWNTKKSRFQDYPSLGYSGSLFIDVIMPTDSSLAYMNYFRDKNVWPKEINPKHPDLETYQKTITSLIQNGTLPRQAGLILTEINQK